jgi:hypothetical protein
MICLIQEITQLIINRSSGLIESQPIPLANNTYHNMQAFTFSHSELHRKGPLIIVPSSTDILNFLHVTVIPAPWFIGGCT